MEIHIHKQNADYLLQVNKIRWSLRTKKSIARFLLIAVLGCTYLIITKLNLSTEENFWDFRTSLGLSAVFLSVFYIFHTIQLKQDYLMQTKKYVERFNKQTEGIDIIINDLGITFKDFEIFQEVKWSSYSYYTFFKNYFVFFPNSEYSNGTMIDTKDLTSDQFSELSKFVSKTLRRKK